MDKVKHTLSAYIQAAEDYESWRVEVRTMGGEYARLVRVSRNLSLNKFAAKIGVSASWLSKIERGLEILPVSVAEKLLQVIEEKEAEE